MTDRPTERDIIADFLRRYGDDTPYRAADVLFGLLDSAGYGGWPTSEEVQELETLQAAVKAHHFDVSHTASRGIGVRASDRALYREAGLPDVGEADEETGAEFIARMEAIVAERDRLGAVVENIREYVAPLPGEEASRVWAVTEQILEHGQVSALDTTGITGAGGEPDDEALAVYIRRVLARSGVEVRPCIDCGQWIFLNDDGMCNDPTMTDGHECDESSAGGAATDDGHVLGEPDPEDGFRPVYTQGGEHVGWSAPGSPPHIVPIGDESSAGGAGSASPDPTPTTGASGVASPDAPPIEFCPTCGTVVETTTGATDG